MVRSGQWLFRIDAWLWGSIKRDPCWQQTTFTFLLPQYIYISIEGASSHTPTQLTAWEIDRWQSYRDVRVWWIHLCLCMCVFSWCRHLKDFCLSVFERAISSHFREKGMSVINTSDERYMQFMLSCWSCRQGIIQGSTAYVWCYTTVLKKFLSAEYTTVVFRSTLKKKIDKFHWRLEKNKNVCLVY